MVAWGIPDFYLADEEAAFIADNLDIPFTTDEMNHYIRTHHTEHPDFAQTIPSSFARLVAYDRTRPSAVPAEQGIDSSAYARPAAAPTEPIASAAAFYIELFKIFGETLIFADAVRTPYELTALADYLAALSSHCGNVVEV